MSRFLLVTLRAPGPADDAPWTRLREEVFAAGGRAWRFHSPTDARRHLEFIEWQDAPGEAPLPEREPIAGSLTALDRSGSVLSREIWEETP